MNDPTWQQVEALFHEALAEPLAERSAFLAQACGADTALRAEVESLLAAYAQDASLAEFIPALVADWAEASHPLINKTIGRYQIQLLLGAGGMGEVFLAEDVQLKRRAALKILPERFTAEAARVRRFEQETHAVLALNHPNIVTLFDLGQADGAYFMATEYVEGETLRTRLRREGALPVREALELALQIAAALTAAHAAGIIHRDIKPENVMIRRDGYVKVLDFGLAKVADAAHLDDTDSGDQSSLTESGAVMGTARYMSPEQARGVRVDHRTDQFSLAVVLYEMLAGRAPFAGETRGDLLVSILTAAPAPLVESTPAVVETILLKALAKESDGRFTSVAEFAEALKAVAAELAYKSRDSPVLPLVSAPMEQPARARQVGFKLQLLVITAVLALAVAFGWWVFDQMRSQPEAEMLAQLKYSLVTSWQDEQNSTSTVLSSSSDGRFLAFAKSEAGQVDIYVQQLNGGKARKVTDDVWADSSPVWSPDNQQLAYLSQRQGKTELWVIPSFGGGGQLLKTLDTAPRWLTSWSRDRRRIYYEASSHLYVVDLPTKEVRRVTDFLSERATPISFAVSADEQWLVFVERVAGTQQLFVAPLAGGTPVQITHDGEANDYPLWLPDGERVLYSSRRNGVQQICLAYRDARKTTQITFSHENMVPWDVSQDGRTVFYQEFRYQADVYLLDVATGAERQIVSGIKPKFFPTFAPDGRRIAWQQASVPDQLLNSEIYLATLNQGDEVRLTDNGFDTRWSPRGDRIAFLRRQGTAYQLMVSRSDGGGERALVNAVNVIPSLSLQPTGWVYASHYSWGTDSERLIYGAIRNGVSNLFAVALNSGAESQITQNTDSTLRMVSPLLAPTGDRFVFLTRSTNAATTPVAIQLHEHERTQMLWQATERVRLLGWLPGVDAVLVGATDSTSLLNPVTVRLLELSVTGKRQPVLAPLENTYLPNVTLSPTGKQVAYVARQSDTDNVWLVSLESGRRRKLTSNADTNRSLGCLTWSPQDNQLCYQKQSNTVSIRMIENFK